MKGFTLIEIIVVVAITAIVAAMGANTITEFQRNAILENDTRELASTLRSARSKSIAGELKPLESETNFTPSGLPVFGITVNGSSYILERTFTPIGSMTPTTEALEQHSLDSSLSISPVAFSVSFARTTGLPNSAQTITVTRLHTSITRIIKIDTNGAISL